MPADATPLYTATFVFAKKQFDDDFHRLDAQIAAVARAIPGYLGEETWDNAVSGLVSNVYYWDSLAALQQLVQHPLHREAKASQSRWLDGFRVTIAQVLRRYGDAGLAGVGPCDPPEQAR
jgi:heme-degrading monooxygenase HmoA